MILKTELLSTVMKHAGRFCRNRIPPQVVIQTTNRCNATCPQCGMRRTANIARYQLPDDTIFRILDACAARSVQAVSFTGGEPFLLFDRLINWIGYAGHVGIPYIRTGTNGFMFCGADRPGFIGRIRHLAERLAATSLRNFWISLDSAQPEIHETMRGLPRMVKGIEKALPIFHEVGIYPSANLGLNRSLGGGLTAELSPEGFVHRSDYLNEFFNTYFHALDRFYCFVADLGFTMVNTCYPMSITTSEQNAGLSAVYAASATENIVRYDADEKAMLYKALLKAILHHRHRLRIFSPLSSVYMLYRVYNDGNESAHAFGCRGGIDFFFIDAQDGNTYPCGYRGNENLGKFWELDIDKIHADENCQRCDWECFRDPSELCSPLLQGLRSPAALVRRMAGNPVYTRFWIQDLYYYSACDLFDGRHAPQTARLKSFKKKWSKSNSISSLILPE